MDRLTQIYFVAFVAGGGLAVVGWLLGLKGHTHHHAHTHAWGLGKLLVPVANLTSLAALACVGGGAGYLARRLGAGAPVSLACALPSGLAAAYAFGGLLSWLQRGARSPGSFRSAGGVATVIARVAPGVTGEISYVRDGARHSLPATTTAERALEAGTEVVVLEVKDGIARVRASAEVLFGEEG